MYHQLPLPSTGAYLRENLGSPAPGLKKKERERKREREKKEKGKGAEERKNRLINMWRGVPFKCKEGLQGRKLQGAKLAGVAG